MDGAVGDVQHLIMLRVLSAQSADQSAPFAPRNPHRFHLGSIPCGLSTKEAAALPIRTLSDRTSLRAGPGLSAQGRQSLRVDPAEFRKPEGECQHQGTRPVCGVPVLHDLVELGLEGDRQRTDRRWALQSFGHQLTHHFRAAGQMAALLELTQRLQFLGGESNPEEPTRRGLSQGGSHAFNRVLRIFNCM